MSISKEVENRAKKVTITNTPLPVKMVHEDYKRPLPSFSLSEDDLPEIKDWEVGKKYKLNIEVEQVSKEKGDRYSMEGPGGSKDKKKISAHFRMLKIGTAN